MRNAMVYRNFCLTYLFLCEECQVTLRRVFESYISGSFMVVAFLIRLLAGKAFFYFPKKHDPDIFIRPTAGLYIPPTAGLYIPPSAGLYIPHSAGLYIPHSAGLYIPPSGG